MHCLLFSHTFSGGWTHLESHFSFFFFLFCFHKVDNFQVVISVCFPAHQPVYKKGSILKVKDFAPLWEQILSF